MHDSRKRKSAAGRGDVPCCDCVTSVLQMWTTHLLQMCMVNWRSILTISPGSKTKKSALFRNTCEEKKSSSKRKIWGRKAQKSSIGRVGMDIGPPENDFCSICHSDFSVPCQANCSHWFCGGCILQVWDHGNALQSCKCPLCRREITLLVPTRASTRQHPIADVPILQRIQRYNRLYGQHSIGLVQRLQDLPFLLRRLLRDIMNPQRSIPLVIRARVYLAMIASFLYVLSPVDLVPEGILGVIGLIDDLIIIFICFLHVAALYRAVLLSQHGGS